MVSVQLFKLACSQSKSWCGVGKNELKLCQMVDSVLDEFHASFYASVGLISQDYKDQLRCKSVFNLYFVKEESS